MEDLQLNDDVKRILLEEWVYLQTQSWIGSRLRAASERFREAGADVYDFTLDRLEAVVEHALDEIPELLTRENLRPATKWVIGTSVPIAARAALDAAVPGSGILTYEIVERLCGIGVGKATDRALARFDP